MSDAAVNERDHCKQQAQIHAQEARRANATIAECYQVATGATGEPGNWHGAGPIRRLLAERDAAIKRAEVAERAVNLLEVDMRQYVKDEFMGFGWYIAESAAQIAAEKKGK